MRFSLPVAILLFLSLIFINDVIIDRDLPSFFINVALMAFVIFLPVILPKWLVKKLRGYSIGVGGDGTALPANARGISGKGGVTVFGIEFRRLVAFFGAFLVICGLLVAYLLYFGRQPLSGLQFSTAVIGGVGFIALGMAFIFEGRREHTT